MSQETHSFLHFYNHKSSLFDHIFLSLSLIFFNFMKYEIMKIYFLSICWISIYLIIYLFLFLCLTSHYYYIKKLAKEPGVARGFFFYFARKILMINFDFFCLVFFLYRCTIHDLSCPGAIFSCKSSINYIAKYTFIVSISEYISVFVYFIFVRLHVCSIYVMYIYLFHYLSIFS